MRLTLKETKTILDYRNNIFGENSKIYLFGSQTKDNAQDI